MDILDSELLKLWKILQQHHVKYIMVGGFATNLHGFHRTTDDIDAWIKDSLENRKNLRKAFNEYGLGDFKLLEGKDIETNDSLLKFFKRKPKYCMIYLIKLFVPFYKTRDWIFNLKYLSKLNKNFATASLFLKKEYSKIIQYENIELIKPEKRDELKLDLEARTGLKISRITIDRIDFLRDTALITVHYND